MKKFKVFFEDHNEEVFSKDFEGNSLEEVTEAAQEWSLWHFCQFVYIESIYN